MYFIVIELLAKIRHAYLRDKIIIIIIMQHQDFESGLIVQNNFSHGTHTYRKTTFTYFCLKSTNDDLFFQRNLIFDQIQNYRR